MNKYYLILTVSFSLLFTDLFSQSDKIPFDGYDLTWINGQSRIKSSILEVKDKKNNLTILTGNAYVDAYYNYNTLNPIDNTHTISSTMGRCNEINLSLVSFGFESYYKNAIGRLQIQFGSMLHIIQELDPTVNRGRNTGTGNLKYIREASAGYHFNRWYGINVEAGILMSFIGLESYMVQDNWCYQRSMSSEFTPFYFQGARIQMYPRKDLKTEIWLINGWQTYNSFYRTPGIGSSTYYRPHSNIQLTTNLYLSHDIETPDTIYGNNSKIRFHHDHSATIRYYHRENSKRVSQAAISINNHYGILKHTGSADTMNAPLKNMFATSIANRLWFNQNKIAWTCRMDYLSNGANYLAYLPSLNLNNDYQDILNANPNTKLNLLQLVNTIDIMPNEYFTFRIEYGYRQSNMPYFAGHGGTTSPSGWINGPSTVQPWRPDLKNKENRITLAMNFRL